MGFDINQFVSSILTSNLFHSVFNNPIWSAMLVVVIILLIIYWVFYDTFTEAVEEADMEDDVSFWRLLFRSGIYSGIAVLGILFIHYKNITSEFDKKNEEKLLQQTVQSAVGTVKTLGAAETLPVTPPQMPQIQPVATQNLISGAFAPSRPSLTTTDNMIFIKGS
jgi:hypothetical protein